ncbi:branched-chain amino acid ABC transporter permease [Candidatus Entotheonella palauensis]|uniref:branched-chain amino acid ABC transporter permease n=1 Tax=Candidatus Entotheonella palauensis TaxID=93172 RepID=UPI000B7E08FB|nr:branched-chain amino acid ABC transporter permease [Candidatus Entotheonella palauensis]
MIYRETGQFKTSYRLDQSIFPIAQDRWAMYLLIAVAYLVIPAIANEYWLQAILIPFLVFAMAALGLNLLTGYAGQLSLGTGAFMAVGAYAAYKLTTAFPAAPIPLVFIAAGLVTAIVGILFGLPSLRIKGLYLAVATLAAQFFLIWLFNRVGWFYNYNPSGTITAPPRTFLGFMITGPEATAPVRYLVALSFVMVFALLAKNMVRSQIGRTWMAIRDMDIAAEIIGIRPLTTKLSAFAISSFYCGVSGALFMFIWLGSVETIAFDITVSFEVLFMVIIGGMGSILGSIIGAGFITVMPILLTNVPHMIGLEMPVDLAKELEAIIFGGLIIFFLIVEPHGLARLWQIGKEKLRRWPFPY